MPILQINYSNKNRIAQWNIDLDSVYWINTDSNVLLCVLNAWNEGCAAQMSKMWWAYWNDPSHGCISKIINEQKKVT